MERTTEQLLRNPDEYPEQPVLKKALGSAFPSLSKMFNAFDSDEFCLSHEWRYYKDGSSWLCKIQFKKKTVCWLSIWDGYFKISFYFTEKTRGGVGSLDISPKVKSSFSDAKPVGRLIPLIIDVADIEQLADVLAIANYKKSLI